MKNYFIALLFIPLLTSGQNGLITTWAGIGVMGNTGDNGPATLAKIPNIGLCRFDKYGNYYIPERGSNKIRKINTVGVITTIAGTGIAGYSGDSGLAINANLNGPVGIALDTNANLFICDYNNFRVRKVDFVTGKITTIAGNGLQGYSGDSGLAVNAELSPAVICIDPFNNVFVGDGSNGTIRKISPNGLITTYAGVPGTQYFGDNGPAILAGIPSPLGMISDQYGNIFIADFTIRKIDVSTGIISKVAGILNQGYSGDNGPADTAQLNGPVDLAIDSIGNLYIADTHNDRIRKVDAASGIITTIVGNGIHGYGGDNGLADTAKLSWPEGVALDSCGNLYINDMLNYRIRKVAFDTNCAPNTAIHILSNSNFNVYPNPVTAELNINNAPIGTTIRVYDVVGRLLNTAIIKYNKMNINTTTWPQGNYFIELLYLDGSRELRKLVK